MWQKSGIIALGGVIGLFSPPLCVDAIRLASGSWFEPVFALV
jgi:hypothetical protein